MSRMKNVHDTLMLPTPGCKLSRTWFLASTRKLESLIPFLDDVDADKVARELNEREDQLLVNQGLHTGFPPQY